MADSRVFLLVVLILVCTASSLGAQDTVRGRVYDGGSGQPLEGAAVFDPGSGRGTTSDAAGTFELYDCNIIRITYIGYRAMERPAGSEFMHVFLEPEPRTLNALVVSAYNSGRRLLETPGAATVLREIDIQRDDAVQIAPVLNQVPGVYMQTSNLNTNRLTVRGIGSRTPYATSKIRAYWDEIPLTGGDGISEVEDIDPDLLGSVEVIKGPASSIYGAGLGGTVLLESQRAEYDATSLRNRTHIGSFGLWKNISTLESSTDRFNIRMNYHRMHWDGYRENNRYDRQGISTALSVYPGDASVLKVVLSWVDLKAFIPSSIDSAAYHDDPRAAAPGWAGAMGFEAYDKVLLGLSFTHRFSNHWEWRSGTFGTFINSYEPRPFNILDEIREWTGIRSRVIYSNRMARAAVSASAGGEFFYEWYSRQTYENNDRMEGDLLTDVRERRQYYNLFVQLQLKIAESWRIDAGFNLNDTRYRMKDEFQVQADEAAIKYRSGMVASPRLALNYLIQGKASVYIHAGQGFSTPTVEEILAADGGFNESIRPEQGWNFEIGSRGILADDRLNYDVALYWMLIRDLLVARRTAEDEFVGVNAGKTWNRGLEIALEYGFLPGSASWNLSTYVRYDLQLNRFRDFTDMGNDYSGNELTGVPRQTIFAGVDGASDLGLYGNLDVLWVDRYPILDDNSLYTEAYQVWNLKLGFRRTFFSRLTIDLYTGIANLFNEKYASQVLINAMAFGNNAPRYYYPGLPRNYYGGLELQWTF